MTAASKPGADAIEWCQPRDCGKIMPRKFIVVYEDAEAGIAVFDDEAEARAHFERASLQWNCYLFGALPNAAPSGLATKPDGGVDGHAGDQSAECADIGSLTTESSTTRAGIKPGPSGHAGGERLLREFVAAFKSGAQGCDMDCDAAQALAEAIETLLSAPVGEPKGYLLEWSFDAAKSHCIFYRSKDDARRGYASVSANSSQPVTIQINPLYTAPPVTASAEEIARLLEEARDMLMERIYGNPARSPGHNARLKIERALALLSRPRPAREGK